MAKLYGAGPAKGMKPGKGKGGSFVNTPATLVAKKGLKK